MLKDGQYFVIGMLGYTANNAWTPRILEYLHQSLKQNVIHFNVDQCRDMLGPLVSEKSMKYKKPVKLSDCLKGFNEGENTPIDLLIIEESYLWFENDLKIPVFYYHTELQMPFTVKYPTHILYKCPEMNDFLHSIEPHGWKSILYKTNLFPAAHPPFWSFEVKKDIQCSFVGPPTDMFDRKRDFLWKLFQKDHQEIMQYIINSHLCDVIHDLGDEHPPRRYNKTQGRSKHMIITAFNGVWIGRTVMEALAAHTIPIIWIENDDCEFMYRYLHFIPFPEKEHNCYFFRKKYELDALAIREYDPQMADRGHQMLLKYHTFGHRAMQILDIIKRTCSRIQVDMPPFEGVWDPMKHRNRKVLKKLK